MSLPLLAQRWVGVPLALHPGKAEIMARAFGPRVFGAETVDVTSGVQAGQLIAPMAETEPDYVRPYNHGAVAIIGIEDTLCAKGKWVGKSSGSTSYEGILAQVAAIRDDPSIRGVIFEVDSPGGEVSGMFTCADAIADLSAEKPTLAVLTETACSAAYALASAARGIVVPKTGWVGSIGVISMHMSMAGALAKAGVKVTIFTAGAHKAELNPYQDIEPELRDTILGEMEELREEFAEAVGRYRGNRLSKAAALATEGATFRGQAAVDVGLADEVADPLAATAAFIAEINRA